MKHSIEIVLDPYLEASIDSALNELEDAIGNIRKFHPQEVSTSVDIDIHDVLAEHQTIAIVWDVQHVKDQRPDLSDAQAWQVLQECQRAHERLNDPMLETIRQVAGNLFPQRQARESKAARIIAGYGNGDDRENLVDLLTDVIHWCEGTGARFDEFCDTARLHVAAECMGDTIKPEGE